MEENLVLVKELRVGFVIQTIVQVDHDDHHEYNREYFVVEDLANTFILANIANVSCFSELRME